MRGSGRGVAMSRRSTLQALRIRQRPVSHKRTRFETISSRSAKRHRRIAVLGAPHKPSNAEVNPSAIGQEPRPASAPRAHDAITSALTPYSPGLLQAAQMVRRELSADSQDSGDRSGWRALQPSQGAQNAKADVAVLPMESAAPGHPGVTAT